MLACNPFQILLVTTEHQYATLRKVSKSMNARNLKVLKIPVANKRLQVCKAIPFVRTRITVMADDDVTWPSTIFPWLLAPFEDEEMGAVGTSQRVRRLKTGTLMERCYNWLGAVYIERRNFEISATHYIDGGTSCMSGRTCAFRTEILQENDFLLGFTTETWRGHLLNADDDNFITRWLVAKRWKTWVQYNWECEIETTLENNPKFRRQCRRWARSNWRSNYTSLFIERHIWR
jgi:cellulose synthase/poly-beta-1,6-N-acetylglucosamine synthase-like glycosyltransferase